MSNYLQKIYLIFVLFFTFSCAFKKPAQVPSFTDKELQISKNLIKENGEKLMVKKIINYHDRYYSAVQSDLFDLRDKVITSLKNRDAADARKSARKNMKRDADLLDELKKYALQVENPDEDDSIIRFVYNRNPLILRKARELLSDDNYFNSIISGEIFNKFKWGEITLISGVENFDEKGTIDIPVLAASLVYLLPDESLKENLLNHSSIIYNESVVKTLLQNPKLLKKLQKNYHLSLENNVIAKVYDAFEFGGSKDFQPIANPEFLPQDCTSGVAMLLGVAQNQFSTYHLISYYDEFFKENSTYWKFSDWEIRDEIIKKLTPIKFEEVAKIKPGTIFLFRTLKDEKSLKDPQGYVGDDGHAGIALGFDGDNFYYLSFERNLEKKNKNGVGVDVLSVAKSEESIKQHKLAFFTFEAKEETLKDNPDQMHSGKHQQNRAKNRKANVAGKSSVVTANPH